MDDDTTIPALLKQLDDPAVEERREAARELAAVGDERPGALAPCVQELTLALDDEDDEVRRVLSQALHAVASDDPTAVRPYVRRLFDHLDDPAPAVRENLSRPVAAVAAIDREQVRVGVDALARRLDDEAAPVRRNAAAALERVAFTHPSDLLPYRDAMHTALTDPDPPVVAGACLTVASLQRHRPDPDGIVVERLGEALGATRADVREAAAAALGAVGTERARTLVRTRLGPEESDREVRRAGRRALREAAFPTDAVQRGDRLDGPGDGTVPEPDEWVSLDAVGFEPRTGRYRGVVQPETPSVPFSPATAAVDVEAAGAAVTLVNEYEGYTVDLWFSDSQVRARYDGDHRGAPVCFEAEDVRPVSGDRMPLLYGTEGDVLTFDVEQAGYAVEVIEVTTDPLAVTCLDPRRGHEIRFRPTGRRPTRAQFRKGRGFEATDISVETAGSPGATDGDVREDPP